MSDNGSDWFSGLGAAQQGGGGNYFAPGVYVCEVVACVRKTSQDPKKKGARMVIFELKVAEALTEMPAQGTLPPSNKVGETCSVICNLDGDYPSLEMGKVKGFLSAVLGAEAAKDDAGWAELAGSVTAPPGQALAGERVQVQAVRKTTRRGIDIAAVSFAPAPPAAE